LFVLVRRSIIIDSDQITGCEKRLRKGDLMEWETKPMCGGCYDGLPKEVRKQVEKKKKEEKKMAEKREKEEKKKQKELEKAAKKKK
jgi:hypothetical protein